MITEFKPCATVDIPRMTALSASMLELLEALDEGGVSHGGDYSPDSLLVYLQSLVAGQRGTLGRTGAGSWAVAPDDADMDADARVDFIFRPTYIAVATLTLSLCEFPLFALEIPGYLSALRNGMFFSSQRGLSGHGFDADLGAIESLRILSLGRVPWLLHRHPAFCPKLKAALDDVALQMAQRLTGATALGAWGEDYSEGFRSALETLRLTNDLDFMQSIEAARKDSTTLSKEELPW